jgi:Smg protein
MKESVIDVLMYLFESYMDEDQDAEPDREALQSQLLEAGFQHTEIERAFDWLDGIQGFQTDSSPAVGEGLRIYHEAETRKLDSECRGFLMFLEQTGVLNPASRERVIDRVMALEDEEIGLDQLKWIILMVLFNLPGEEAAYHWMEHGGRAELSALNRAAQASGYLYLQASDSVCRRLAHTHRYSLAVLIL